MSVNGREEVMKVLDASDILPVETLSGKSKEVAKGLDLAHCLIEKAGC